METMIKLTVPTIRLRAVQVWLRAVVDHPVLTTQVVSLSSDKPENLLRTSEPLVRLKRRVHKFAVDTTELQGATLYRLYKSEYEGEILGFIEQFKSDMGDVIRYFHEFALQNGQSLALKRKIVIKSIEDTALILREGGFKMIPANELAGMIQARSATSGAVLEAA